ncbi:hypothetical protein GCM10010912_66110 [Paenibacillus albidus]|uniref:Uncharacterized protein n=1 Tax=Paenibacillus albidus TaxID=2041023 RepID=A0A917FWU6_9BACL|nr:hypothetical protein [Paenibacillus albidus]GGG12443.1 hypothetical protein GCM10010912_66110 [Paenibacillus albidus]
MGSSSYKGRTLFSYIAKGLTLIFCVPILGVWTAGSAVCAVIALIGAILGTFGYHGVAMNLYPGYSLPRILSLPFGLLLSLALLISFYYTRRWLRGCLQFIKS